MQIVAACERNSSQKTHLTTLLTASDPASDPASDSVSDSVSDSATLQPCEQLTDPEIMQSSLRYELPRGVKRASQQARHGMQGLTGLLPVLRCRNESNSCNIGMNMDAQSECGAILTVGFVT